MNCVSVGLGPFLNPAWKLNQLAFSTRFDIDSLARGIVKQVCANFPINCSNAFYYWYYDCKSKMASLAKVVRSGSALFRTSAALTRTARPLSLSALHNKEYSKF